MISHDYPSHGWRCRHRSGRKLHAWRAGPAGLRQLPARCRAQWAGAGGRGRDGPLRVATTRCGSMPRGGSRFPAPFRQVLARDGFDGLYCYPALDRPAIDARRQRAAAGDRAADRELSALFGRAGGILASALYGTSETLNVRRRGAGDPDRAVEGPRRDHGCGRRSSALATSFRSGSPNAFARSSRRPPRRCARSSGNWAPGGRRGTRSEHGNDEGPRHRQRCRWRTGPSHSRARPPRARAPRRFATAASMSTPRSAPAATAA